MDINEKDLIRLVEDCIDSAIRENYPHDWYEDQITRDICKNLRNKLGRIRNVIGYSPWSARRIRWTTYKQTGAKETKWGDVAVLVDIVFKDGTRLEGVGFLEAKKRILKKASFDELRERQLKTISKNAPLAQLLFYDYEPSTASSESVVVTDWESPYENASLLTNSRVVCMPIGAVLAGGIRSREQLYTSIPFSHQLVNRYLNGFDLHHREELVNTIKGHVSGAALPQFLLRVLVRYDNDVPDDSSINQAIWQPIDNDSLN